MADVAGENLNLSYEQLTAALAAATANPQPDYTLPGGISVSYGKYLEMLTAQIEAARALKAATRKPYCLRSRRRG